MRAASLLEHGDQFAKFVVAEVAELSFVASAYFGGERVEQREAGVGDADLDDAAIRRFALAANKGPLIEFVEQPGHVGSAGD